MSAGWRPPELAVVEGGRFAVRHAWCVGRNYAEHAREMGVDPERHEPVFFSKPAAAVLQTDAVTWPPMTGQLHHEGELVVFLRAGGRDLTPAQAMTCVFGYAAGCDLTRRDVQARAKAAGHPWALSKGFDQSGPVGEILPAEEWKPEFGYRVRVSVNDQLRQRASLGAMIWSVGDLLSRLSREITLHPGDAVFTGTPSGVSELSVGDRVRVEIDGLPELAFRIAEAAD